MHRVLGFCAVSRGFLTELIKKNQCQIVDAVMKMKTKACRTSKSQEMIFKMEGHSRQAQTIKYIRECIKDCKIEVLIPDFEGFQNR